jgi:osmoprotectant transport system permease protein
LIALRSRVLESVILAGSSLMYAVPSLALLAILVPIVGLSQSKYAVLVGLVIYSMVILVRAVVTGLRGVPEGVVEAARGMGFGSRRLLFRVQLPLALPTIFAGLRVATVSTVALVTLGTVVDHGGLGNLLTEAFSRNYRFEALTASVLCVALAFVGDLLLLVIERLLSPWRRKAAVR